MDSAILQDSGGQAGREASQTDEAPEALADQDLRLADTDVHPVDGAEERQDGVFRIPAAASPVRAGSETE